MIGEGARRDEPEPPSPEPEPPSRDEPEPGRAPAGQPGPGPSAGQPAPGDQREPGPRRAPAPGQRQRDAERSRQALLAAALDEFSERGFAGARVADIARRAGVNKQLINYYFGSKEGLYLALQRAWLDREQEFAPGPYKGQRDAGATRAPNFVLSQFAESRYSDCAQRFSVDN